MMEKIEMQRYLLDLQGYAVIENALDPDEVATLNALLDRRDLAPPAPGESPRFGSAPDGSGFLDYGKPFCDLLDHPLIMPVLRFRLGDCFRLDRLYGLHVEGPWPRRDLHADYGATSPIARSTPGEYFHFARREITDGFMVVMWNLTDAGPDHGGWCCIPGSHKSNYRLPRRMFDAPEDSPHVVTPHAPAGSAVLFTEALTHGASAWAGAHRRRVLVYKYCVAHTAWRATRVRPPARVELTPRQRILFRGPAEPYRNFPSLFDGEEEETVRFIS